MNLHTLTLSDPTGVKGTGPKDRKQVEQSKKVLTRQFGSRRVPPTVRQNVILDDGKPSFSLLVNNCSNFVWRLFAPLATCEVQVLGISATARCRPTEEAKVAKLSSKPVASRNQYLVKLFMTEHGEYIQGFEDLRMLLEQEKVPFQAFILQAKGKSLRLWEYGSDIARKKIGHGPVARAKIAWINNQKKLHYFHGHASVGLILNNRIQRVYGAGERVEIVPCEAYTVTFGANPADAEYFGPPQNFPKHGWGAMQAMFLKNTRQLKMPDMWADNIDTILRVLVETRYDPEDPATFPLRERMLAMLKGATEASTCPFPAPFDQRGGEEYQSEEFRPYEDWEFEDDDDEEEEEEEDEEDDEQQQEAPPLPQPRKWKSSILY